MSDPVRFVLNGELVEIRDAPPTMTLLNWLRETRRMTGTKEGCAEGDCGACTVATRAPGQGWLAVNACIQLLPMLHGRDVVTIEHVGAPYDDGHPVQKAVARLHGSQCGFCTPGFVMSLWVGYENGAPASPECVADQLAGNLCRCTGYGPLIEAAAAAAEERADPAPSPPDPPVEAESSLSYETNGRRCWSPISLAEAASLKAAQPEARLIAGATDVGLWVTKNGYDPSDMIYIGRVAELRRIETTATDTTLGAAVSWEEARAALAPLYPDLGELLRRVAGAQVRNAGTIGGNIANGSPIGDLPPPLIALGAKLRLVSAAALGLAEREIPLEDFFIEYGRQHISRYELVASVTLPNQAPGRLACYKISKRFDSDITAVLGCFRVVIEAGVATEARLAFGGMAGVPKRAMAAEAAMVGRPWSQATIAAAQAALEQDFQPLDDQRATSGYRMTVAKNLLQKYYLEMSAPETATRLVGRGAVSL
ncbi:MAG: xanthine dehydrogenase small subunit [Neomegalonema sp.]|nr:xanthine dehydrogenase small subunit [Neomegalonema sp.]